MRKSICNGLLCVWAVFAIYAGAQEARLPAKKQVLFVCTGNHYRSRFAEALFNQKAGEAGLDWRAVSRGFQLVPSQHGMSSVAQRELIKRGVPQEMCNGSPKALTKEDLEKSDYFVLMDEAEHRPMLDSQFPVHDDRKIHFWHIGDTGKMNPSTACQAMAAGIDELLRTLERYAATAR